MIFMYHVGKHWYPKKIWLYVVNNKNRRFTPLKNSNGTPFNSSTKLPVTI